MGGLKKGIPSQRRLKEEKVGRKRSRMELSIVLLPCGDDDGVDGIVVVLVVASNGGVGVDGFGATSLGD